MENFFFFAVKQAQYLKIKSLQRDSNPQPLSLQTTTQLNPFFPNSSFL